MNIASFQKELGRIPNEIEKAFFKAFWKSNQLQSVFDSEVSQSEIPSNDTKLMTIVAQSSSDPRNRIADNTLHALNGKKIASLLRKDGSFTLGILPSQDRHQSKMVHHLYFLYGSNLKGMARSLYQEDWFEAAIPINKAGLGHALFRMLKDYECGLKWTLETQKDLTMLSRKGINGILILLNRNPTIDFNNLSNKHKCNYMDLGQISKGKNIDLIQNDQSVGHIPLTVLNNIVNQNSNIDELKIQTSVTTKPATSLNEKKRYNKELITLMKEGVEIDDLRFSQQHITTRGHIAIIPNSGILYGLAVNNNETKYYQDYLMKSVSAIANSSRQLACAGIRPKVCSGIVKISDSKPKNKGSYLKGIKDAGKFLNLSIDHLSFEKGHQDISGEFCSGGVGINNELFPDIFPQSNLFISMLGSHRGELGGSRFLSLVNQENTGVQPIVDLSMESRLQETILTSIQGGLIQSARAVGSGGLAISIAKSFGKHTQLGARIHVSRKLKVYELLFGETQGLVIVTIKETDLMEFERVCMTIGIPATTIGRVTDDGIFSFNDSIKLNIKDIN